MKIRELTTYQRRRFLRNRVCHRCNRIIFDNEDVTFIIKTAGRRKFYEFYHVRCGCEQEQQEKKE